MIPPKYAKLLKELETFGTGQMKCFGYSMTPIFPGDGCLMTYKKQTAYKVGDIVFCSVHGRFIDAHLITQAGPKGYLISNNHGHDNGWTKKVYGKVIRAEYGTTIKHFN